jgi:membrane-associated phospholipid phosphatase
MREIKRSAAVFIIFALTLGFIVPVSSFGNEQDTFEYKLNKEFFKRFGSDVYEVIKSPAGWQGHDLWRLTAVLGAGTFLFVFDENIDDWSQERRTPSSEDVAQFGSSLGDGRYLGAMIATLYIAGEVFGKQGLRKTALLSLESWLTSGAFVLGMKAITGRARPYTDKGPYAFHPITFRSDHSSFPSGHATSAFALAAVIADQSDCLAIDILAFSLSSFVAISRVHERSHWASDAFMGAAIGYFIGKKISALHKGKDRENIQIGFCLTPKTKGLTVSLYF